MIIGMQTPLLSSTIVKGILLLYMSVFHQLLRIGPV